MTGSVLIEVDSAQKQAAERLIDFVEREFNALGADGRKIFAVSLSRRLGSALIEVKKEMESSISRADNAQEIT